MISKQIWHLEDRHLVWEVAQGVPHRDNYEMSGAGCDCIVDYGVDAQGKLLLDCSCYFPTLRTIPNDTHATLEVNVAKAQMPGLLLDGKTLEEYPVRFVLDGMLLVQSRTDAMITVHRRFLPACHSLCSLEIVTLTAQKTAELTVSQPQTKVLGETLGTKGIYVSRIRHNADPVIHLEPGVPYSYTVAISAAPASESCPFPDAAAELEARYARIAELCEDSLVVDTGIPELDAMTRFSKLRAGESIFDTISGKFHSPGGRTYYAAVWCNDQVEYTGPHFAMTGDETAIEASLNAYRAYVPFMSDSYRPIPSSVIAEGLDIWNGAGDRGDAAMYLYGASLFALYLGEADVARALYGPIRWCAEYCRRQVTPEGVVRSDTDELENRIPTDHYANLSTASLCYGGLLTAAKLADALEDRDTAAEYRRRAAALESSIEAYFGADLRGYHTYRYSKGFDTLRSWICLPLCAGITRREEGTVAAMLSDYLWTEEGMLSCEVSQDCGDRTIWDRSTLYGFKAAFLAGRGDRVLPLLRRYCRKRLLCDRVPYPVEAYPEGGKRHLSAESALFVRMVTEGILGIAPESLTAFSFIPRLPEGMPHIRLSKLRIAGACWTIHVDPQCWTVYRNDELAASGKTGGQRVIIA